MRNLFLIRAFRRREKRLARVGLDAGRWLHPFYIFAGRERGKKKASTVRSVPPSVFTFAYGAVGERGRAREGGRELGGRVGVDQEPR